MDPGAEAARAESIRHNREVVAEVWTRLRQSKVSDHAAAGLLNTAISAQKEIDRLRGVTPPERVEVSHEFRTIKEFAIAQAGKLREERIRVVDMEPWEIGESAPRKELECGT